MRIYRGSEDTSEVILREAASLFARKGYVGTSMAEIAKAVGIEKASIYYHFRSKKEIVTAIIDRASVLRFLGAEISARPALHGDQRLRLFMTESIVRLLNNRDLAKVTLEYMSRSREDTEAVRQSYSGQRHEVVAFIEGGIREGLLCTRTPELDALAIVGMISSAVEWYSETGRYSIEEIANRFAALIFDGLRARQGPSSEELPPVS